MWKAASSSNKAGIRVSGTYLPPNLPNLPRESGRWAVVSVVRRRGVTVTDFVGIMGQVLLYRVDGAVGDRVISRGLQEIAGMAEVPSILRSLPREHL